MPGYALSHPQPILEAVSPQNPAVTSPVIIRDYSITGHPGPLGTSRALPGGALAGGLRKGRSTESESGSHCQQLPLESRPQAQGAQGLLLQGRALPLPLLTLG